MRTADPNFIIEKNKETKSPIRLYTVYNYDGAGNNRYFAEADEDIWFRTVYYLTDVEGNHLYDVEGNRLCVDYDAGQTYTRFPITFDRISENTRGEIDQMRVTVSNISRLIQSDLEAYDLEKCRVSIKTVFYEYLDDTNVVIEDIFYIDSYTADEKDVVFTLSSKFDILDISLPLRKYTRNSCPWKFKGTECGYAGSETSCSRLLSRCRTLGNQLRFGGFPSIPSRRMYIG